MAAVKGSKQYRVKVVRAQPLRPYIVGFVGLLCLIVSAYFAYWFGQWRAVGAHDLVVNEVNRLEAELVKRQEKILTLEQQVANMTVGAEIDREANESVRSEVVALKSEIADLVEENSFYKGLMAPTETNSGLTIGQVELGVTERARVFRFKVVIQQLAQKHELLNGELDFQIVGVSDGLPMVYSVADLSSDYQSPQVKLRFKYFQTIAGRIELPETFEPRSIELVARSFGKKSKTVSKRLGWLVEES